MLIQSGELDTYDKPDTCAMLVQSLPAAAKSFISHRMYAQATHAWDRLTPSITVTDPFSHLGQGGQVIAYLRERLLAMQELTADGLGPRCEE